MYMCIFAFKFVKAQDKTYLTPDVNIISVTPVQGSGLSLDRVPEKFRHWN